MDETIFCFMAWFSDGMMSRRYRSIEQITAVCLKVRCLFTRRHLQRVFFVEYYGIFCFLGRFHDLFHEHVSSVGTFPFLAHGHPCLRPASLILGRVALCVPFS